MKPLYKWAGGKNKLINNNYQPYLPKSFDTYCEPFFGGGAMFTWAFNKNPKANFVINDINSHIMEIYRSIKNDYDNFRTYLNDLESEYIKLRSPLDIDKNKKLEKDNKISGNRKDWAKIFSIEPTRRYFYFMKRDVYAFEYNTLSRTEEAALLYFLLQTSFNGVWQINTNTNGRFGTPCGLLKEKTEIYDKENMNLWHKALQNTDIRSGDFSKCLDVIDNNTFLFLDPPYRGCFTNYGTQDDDQFQDSVIDFYKKADATGAHCMLSNRELDDNFFEDRFNAKRIKKFDITYTAGRRKKEVDENGNESFSAKKAIEILIV
jgi:DNA adenine methylase